MCVAPSITTDEPVVTKQVLYRGQAAAGFNRLLLAAVLPHFWLRLLSLLLTAAMPPVPVTAPLALPLLSSNARPLHRGLVDAGLFSNDELLPMLLLSRLLALLVACPLKPSKPVAGLVKLLASAGTTNAEGLPGLLAVLLVMLKDLVNRPVRAEAVNPTAAAASPGLLLPLTLLLSKTLARSEILEACLERSASR